MSEAEDIGEHVCVCLCVWLEELVLILSFNCSHRVRNVQGQIGLGFVGWSSWCKCWHTELCVCLKTVSMLPVFRTGSSEPVLLRVNVMARSPPGTATVFLCSLYHMWKHTISYVYHVQTKPQLPFYIQAALRDRWKVCEPSSCLCVDPKHCLDGHGATLGYNRGPRSDLCCSWH